MANRELWYLFISGQQDENTGIFGNFYTYGSHLGEALEKTILALKDYNFSNHNLTEATLLDSIESIESIDNYQKLIEISRDVFLQPTTFTFPISNSDQMFYTPIGIVKSAYDDEFEYDLIKECFVAYDADENGIFEFALVLKKEHLIDIFLRAIDFLPSVNGFWIYINNLWENQQTELWVAKHFTECQTVKDFLLDNRIDTLENGFLDIVTHSSQGETNLTLCSHKKVQLFTKDKIFFQEFLGKITDLGFKQTRDFYNIEFGYHHFHYRLANSLSRDDFKQMLTDNNFELIEKWD